MTRILALAAALAMSGCATPSSQVRSVAGKTYVLHLDHDDNPCGNRGWQNGCHTQIAGISQVWASSIAPHYVVPHEEAHVAGMRHGPWSDNCATVTVPLLPRYPLGARICVDGKREIVLGEGI